MTAGRRRHPGGTPAPRSAARRTPSRPAGQLLRDRPDGRPRPAPRPPATVRRPRRPRRSHPVSVRRPRPGSTPNERHSAASDTITANSAGWTTSTRPAASPRPRAARPAAASPPAPRAPRRSAASSPRRPATAHQPDAHPCHCDPWPGKTKTGADRRRPARTRSRRRQPARSHASVSDPRRPAPARCSSPERGASETADVGELAVELLLAYGCRQSTLLLIQRLGVCAPTAARGPRPPTAAAAPRRPAPAPAPPRASRWAFVPVAPNDETPARRGRTPAGQGCASLRISTSPADQSTCGDGSSTCKVARQHARAATPAPS